MDVAVLKQYEGVYRADRHATRTLRVVDGTLTVQRTGGMRFELTAIAVDTFVYPGDFTRLQVLRNATGNVTAMRFWSDGEGEGVVAPLTDLAVPVDFTLPRDAFGRLVGKYWGLALLISAAIAIFYAAKRWRRRKRRTANTYCRTACAAKGVRFWPKAVFDGGGRASPVGQVTEAFQRHDLLPEAPCHQTKSRMSDSYANRLIPASASGDIELIF